MLDSLREGLQKAFQRIRDAVLIDDATLRDILRDVQRALLAADVPVKLVFDVTKRVKERFKREPTPPGLSQRDHLIHILTQELRGLLGEGEPLRLEEKPWRVMLLGLFGSGKTTTTGKLARYYAVRGYRVAVVETDTWRPAARDQLRQLAEKAGVDAYTPEAASAVEAWEKARREMEARGRAYDLILIDTAGRDSLNETLVQEIKALGEAVKPDETLLVVPADAGKAVERDARAFHDLLGVDKLIITRMDGTGKAGGALAAAAATGARVAFIGTGEKLEDLESFDPESFLGRLLGMGDLKALLERAEEAFSREEAEEKARKLLRGDFTLRDLMEQLDAVKRMGSLQKLLEYIPGVGGRLPREVVSVQEDQLKRWKAAMQSMTPEELDHPDILNESRIRRIARGAGVREEDVRLLLKQYKQSRKLLRMMRGKRGKDLQRMLGNLPEGFQLG